MKKFLKSFLILVLVLPAFCIVGVIGLYLTHQCPPQGPWPMPPWCSTTDQGRTFLDSTEAAAQIQSTVSLTITAGPNTPTDRPTPTPGPVIGYHVQVTVPYGSEGDIYLGYGNNPTYLKLDQVNQVTYQGDLEIGQGAVYYYSRGAAGKTSTTTYTADFPEAFDAVIDWKDSNTAISVPGFQKGMTLGGSHWRKDEYQNLDWALDTAIEYGVTHILLIPVAWVYPDQRGSELKLVYFEDPLYASDPRFNSAEWGWWGASLSDDQIREIARKAEDRGLKVVLKPHIDVWDGTSRGAINPADPEAFFANYTDYIVRYAVLAQEINADLFVVGTELDSVANSNGLFAKRGIDVTSQWRNVIDNVRKVYDGDITYSVSCFRSCGGPSQVKFWGSLDFIGFEPYFAVTGENDPTLAELKQGFVGNFNKWAEPLSEKYGKQILLTEVNAYAFDGLNTDPIAMFTNPEDHPLDKQEQADYYEALFQAVVELPYIQGTYPWPFWLYMGEKTEYDRILAEKDGRRDNLIAVLAGQVVKKWYLEIEP